VERRSKGSGTAPTHGETNSGCPELYKGKKGKKGLVEGPWAGRIKWGGGDGHGVRWGSHAKSAKKDNLKQLSKIW